MTPSRTENLPLFSIVQPVKSLLLKSDVKPGSVLLSPARGTLATMAKIPTARQQCFMTNLTRARMIYRFALAPSVQEKIALSADETRPPFVPRPSVALPRRNLRRRREPTMFRLLFLDRFRHQAIG